MACIYALEFPNGKMYVGQTRLANTNSRFSAHINRAEKTKRNERLYNAWRKYGAPTIRTLIICSIDMLNYYEEACIKLYDTFKNGYNSTTGGDSPLEYTALRNKKIAASKIGNKITLGRIQTEEEKLKKSIASKAAWANPEKRARMGHNAYTAESRAKISTGTKGKKFTRTPEQCRNISHGILIAKQLRKAG